MPPAGVQAPLRARRSKTSFGDGRRRHQTTRVRASLELVVRVDGADADANASEKKDGDATRRGAVSPPRSVEARVGARRGERYWPVTLELEEASGSGSRFGSRSGSSSSDAAYDALYRRRRLPVQRLAGALPYAADPTGARAGLSDALRDAAAATALRPPRTQAGCARTSARMKSARMKSARMKSARACGGAAIPRALQIPRGRSRPTRRYSDFVD